MNWAIHLLEQFPEELTEIKIPVRFTSISLINEPVFIPVTDSYIPIYKSLKPLFVWSLFAYYEIDSRGNEQDFQPTVIFFYWFPDFYIDINTYKCVWYMIFSYCHL